MGTIAPHQNNEVRLVLAGTKPLASIENKKDAQGYALAIALGSTGALCTEARPTTDCPQGEVLVVLPSNKHLLAQYKELTETGVALYGIKEYHRRVGALFGYTPEDTTAFINAEIDCNCTKCKGFK